MPSTSVDLQRECFGTSSWRLVQIDVGRYRYTPLLIEAIGNTRFGLWLLASVFSLSTFGKVGGASGTVLAHAASVVVDFEVVQFKIPRAPQKVRCLLRFMMLVLNLGVLLKWILAKRRHTLPSGVWRTHALFMAPGICVLAFHFREGRKSLARLSASVVVNFEVVRLRVSKSGLGVLPARHRHQRFPPDWVVKNVTTFKYAFVFGEFFIKEGLLIFMFFSSGEAEYVDIFPWGWSIIS